MSIPYTPISIIGWFSLMSSYQSMHRHDNGVFMQMEAEFAQDNAEKYHDLDVRKTISRAFALPSKAKRLKGKACWFVLKAIWVKSEINEMIH